MAGQTTKVTVPKEHGDDIRVSYGGEIENYRVTDGHVTVQNRHLDKFLRNVQGAKAVDATATHNTSTIK